MSPATGSLRVAVDVSPLIAGRTGVARYARALTPALVARGVDVRPYTLGRAVVALPTGADGLDAVRRVRIPLRVLHRAWAIGSVPPIDWLVGAAEVIHTLDLVAPPAHRPSVATVHDLDALERPELHSPRAIAIQRAQLDSLKRVDAIVTNSETTKAALCRHGVDRARIVVGGLGVSLVPAAPPVLGDRASILTVGSLDLRKGQDVLLRALAKLSRPDVEVVLAGPDGWQANAVRSLVESLHLDGRVVFLGHVSDRRLAELYAAATIVCVPSRAEGFGLAVLEAMAAGVPVVASDLAATREIGADVAAFVPPEDPDALAHALSELLGDEARRAALGAAGRVRASRYTWDVVAEATIGAYERALGAH